ncbi:11293_t:CDS:1 [Paraglomus occultum]|uniref:11293_t:CDS:1 n=1 Tax=Paraglomus occultum TaxID=144539 RepID=A0A9N9AS32_9GLOM|nr:11293_t:CDS:1 [Paraglomus occultum]
MGNPSDNSSARPIDLQQVRDKLVAASSDLYYVSEGDEPLEFVFFENKELERLPESAQLFAESTTNLDSSHAREEMETECVDKKQFFGPLTISDHDPYGQQEKYRKLEQTMEELFGSDNVLVYKVKGRLYSTTEIYIVGLIRGLGIAGIRTRSIET